MAAKRGVNLGNWLVLEKWMHPELFAGTTAEDETELCLQLGDEKFERLKRHRDSYITLDDFKYLQSHGFNAVRIPVPHFIFDDCQPYVGCIEYLDRAFEWARQTDIVILIDLHTVRDSQNAFDNGGICGVCKWHLKQENIDHTVMVLEKLAKRYRDDAALYGIEFLNEPATPQRVEEMRRQGRYKPHDEKRAEGSAGVPDELLRDFYLRCYHALRPLLRDETVLMFHDGFRLQYWKDFMQDGDFKNVVLDTHPYVAFGAWGITNPTLLDILKIPLEQYQQAFDAMKDKFKICVGEWCFAFPGNALHESDTPLMRDAAIRAAAAAQLYLFDQADSWFYWSYKLISEPQGWDARKAIEHGWMPNNVSDP